MIYPRSIVEIGFVQINKKKMIHARRTKYYELIERGVGVVYRGIDAKKKKKQNKYDKID